MLPTVLDMLADIAFVDRPDHVMSLDDDFKLLKAKSREVCRLVGAHLTKQYGFEKMAVRWTVSSAVKAISPRRRFEVGLAHFGWVFDSNLSPTYTYFSDEVAEVAHFDVDKTLLPDPTVRATAASRAYDMTGRARNFTLKFDLNSRVDVLSYDICAAIDRTLPSFMETCSDHLRLLTTLRDPNDGPRYRFLAEERLRSVFALLYRSEAPQSSFDEELQKCRALLIQCGAERSAASAEAYAKAFAERWLRDR